MDGEVLSPINFNKDTSGGGTGVRQYSRMEHAKDRADWEKRWRPAMTTRAEPALKSRGFFDLQCVNFAVVLRRDLDAVRTCDAPHLQGKFILIDSKSNCFRGTATCLGIACPFGPPQLALTAHSIARGRCRAPREVAPLFFRRAV